MSVFDLIRTVFGLGESDRGEPTDVSVDLEPSDDDEPEEVVEDTDSTEQAEEPEVAHAETDTGDADPASSTDEEPTTDSSEPDERIPVDTVRGIGPAYADRLARAGVETVEELLAADPETLAEEIDLSETRVSGWQDHASE